MSVFDPLLMKKMVIEGMIKDLKHKDSSVRKLSAETLGKTLAVPPLRAARLKARAIKALTQALKDKDESVQKAAKKALDKIRQK